MKISAQRHMNKKITSSFPNYHLGESARESGGRLILSGKECFFEYTVFQTSTKILKKAR